MFSIDDNVALLTKHKKEAVIKLAFIESWEGNLEVVTSFDTDELGTFTGSVKRTLPPQQAALKKAYLACEHSGLTQGIGSEGSFNSFAGIGNLNEEVLAFVDVEREIEVIAVAHQMTSLQPIKIDSEEELLEKLKEYPRRQSWFYDYSQPSFCLALSEDRIGEHLSTLNFPIVLQPDFRAMNCPERRETIFLAAKNLVEKLLKPCPKCDHPGFSADKKITGLPCEICGSPTSQVKAAKAQCRGCAYEEMRPSSQPKASSFYCEFCNP